MPKYPRLFSHRQKIDRIIFIKYKCAYNVDGTFSTPGTRISKEAKFFVVFEIGSAPCSLSKAKPLPAIRSEKKD
jgi:hypothetical protein